MFSPFASTQSTVSTVRRRSSSRNTFAYLSENAQNQIVYTQIRVPTVITIRPSLLLDQVTQEERQIRGSRWSRVFRN